MPRIAFSADSEHPEHADGWRRQVSPILVRPVREQLEHDRVIRLLHAKFRRKYEAAINPGAERNASVGTGPAAVYPDLVLSSAERGRRLQAVVEVETAESVNHLEALAEWVPYGRLRMPFHLYVPSGMVDVARRLCDDNDVRVSEIWSFHAVGEDVRFTLVHRAREPIPAPRPRSTPAARPRKTAAAVRGASKSARPGRRTKVVKKSATERRK
jgi:hypothetical protein